MNNELIVQKSWWKRNWKWLVSVCGISLFLIGVFITSGMGEISAHFVRAYSDMTLYNNAIDKVNSVQKVKELLGEIEPIDNLAIFEGEVQYSNNNKTVNTTIRLKGTKGYARMDIIADKVNNEWVYKKINIRIKNPPEKKQTIEIIKAE